MKKLMLPTVILLFAIFFAYLLVLTKTPTATINNHSFRLYLAKTPQEKEVGLSKYDTIPQDSGMLFLFERPSFYAFWMKDMKFPIDIIFISKNRIVTIYSSVKPPKTSNQILSAFYPLESANMVLEINANLSNKYGFKNGDIVKINNL